MTKECKKCGEVKRFDEFHSHPSNSDGKFGKCKVCIKAYQDSRKEHRAKLSKAWRTQPDVRAREKARLAKSQRENKKSYNAKQRAWRIKNQDKHRAYMNEYMRNKRATDPNYRISHRMRNRILEVLNGKSKGASTLKLLGCSYDEFRSYFASKFTDGMSWEAFDRGEIHIDHIVPCCAFNLEDVEEQKKCFHHTNLQPLWEEDNFAKNGSDREMKKARLG